MQHGDLNGERHGLEPGSSSGEGAAGHPVDHGWVGPATNRRGFLGLAGASAALLMTGCDAISALAAVPRLSAHNHRRIRDGVQHFRTRPDLKPPNIMIRQPRRGSLGGYIVTEGHRGGSQPGPLIFDQHGRIMWFKPVWPTPSHSHRAFNVGVRHYQGKPVLSWFEGAVVGNHGQGHYRLFDTTYNEIAEVHAANGYFGDLHEFILTKEGTALFTCYGTKHGPVTFGGVTRTLTHTYGVVQEVDVATGKLLFQWRSDHHVPVSKSYMPLPGPGGGVWDYFHINAISIDPADQNLVISSRNTAACYKVNRKTGRVMWQLGGKHGDFHIGHGAHFFFQHDVRLHPDGVMTVFDNEGGPPQRGSHSRALVLAIDEKRRKVKLKHAFVHDPPLYSSALGSVERVDHGGIFVGWGRSSTFTEYSATGEVLFDGQLGAGENSYRTFRHQWTGMPTTKPDVAVARSNGDAHVFVSWNGATEVTNWGVLGGESATHLHALGTAAVLGFETKILVPSAPAVLVVVGYDRHGRELGRSAAVKD